MRVEASVGLWSSPTLHNHNQGREGQGSGQGGWQGQETEEGDSLGVMLLHTKIYIMTWSILFRTENCH